MPHSFIYIYIYAQRPTSTHSLGGEFIPPTRAQRSFHDLLCIIYGLNLFMYLLDMFWIFNELCIPFGFNVGLIVAQMSHRFLT